MAYRIDRPALNDFVQRQASLVETTPLPADLVGVLPREADELGRDELHAVWLGAGLATQIGLALLEAPERFITDQPATA